MKITKPMRRLALAALCGAGCWIPGHALPTLAATANVTIEDFDFNPSTTTINVNDTVKWTWSGSAPHTTTSTTGLWNSPQQTSGTFSHTFGSAGSFPYMCTVHPFMTGTVTVKSAAVPPTVTITNPANGAILIAPASFNLAATASSTSGTVTSVQFFQGTTSLGSKTAPPYSVGVSNLAAGTYTFSAVATDNSGLKATNSISLIVDAPPTVTITSPTNGASFLAPWTGSIQATVGDADGTVSKVQFFAGVTSLGTVTNPPANATLNVNLAAGNYSLTAVATDNRGASTTSPVVNISVVTPGAIVISAASRVLPSGFQFTFTANPGSAYVIWRAQGLTSFTPIATNTAASDKVTFLDNNATADVGFYRVQLLPHP
jgi:plastocyanin